MTIQFKTFLVAIVVVFMLLMSAKTYAEPQYKLCFAGPLPNNQIGCYDGEKTTPIQEWLNKIDPNLRIIKVTLASEEKGILKIYYERIVIM